MSLFVVILIGLLMIIVILAVQVTILLKIKKMIFLMSKKKNVFQNPYTTCQNLDLQKYKNSCQNCKYRLSYIHIGVPGGEDFYYRCKIRNIEVSLKDSCERYKEDR